MSAIVASISQHLPRLSTTIYATAWGTLSASLWIGCSDYRILYAPGVGLAYWTWHAYTTSKTVQTSSQENARNVQTWTSLACLVISSVATIFSISVVHAYAQVCVQQRLQSEDMFTLYIPLAAMGCGVPLAKWLYMRGLELFQMPSWDALNKYMQRSLANKLMPIVWDQWLFCMAMISPTSIESIPYNEVAQRHAMGFLTNHEKIQSIEHRIEVIPHIDVPAKIEYWTTSLQYLDLLPETQQWEMVPKLLRIGKEIGPTLYASQGKTSLIELFSPALQSKILEKIQQLQRKHSTCILQAQKEWSDLQPLLQNASVQNAPELSKRVHTLRDSINTHLSDIETFCPNLTPKP